MTATQSATANKSTTDRSVPFAIRAVRLWFAIESRFAPESAERRAARMFVTPPRQKRGSNSINARLKKTGVDPGTVTQAVVTSANASVSAMTFGSGPTVMLVHGWGGTANDMVPAAVAFARGGYRSVVFDMPGHGASPGRESSLVEFLRAMRAVADALGAPDLIVGHSFGGAAAVLGITELALPVRGAVLFAPAPGPAYYVDRFARTVGLPAERTDGMMKRVVERVGRSVESLDALVAARRAAVPALILHDPADREVPYAFAERMAATWIGSRLEARSSLGHKRILRDPATISAALDFARSVVAPSPA